MDKNYPKLKKQPWKQSKLCIIFSSRWSLIFLWRCYLIIFCYRIMQLQNAIMDVQTKINHERKEREVDQQTLNTRISECNTDVSEIRRKRDTDLKALEVSTKELATMGDAEKQRIMFVYILFIF